MSEEIDSLHRRLKAAEQNADDARRELRDYIRLHYTDRLLQPWRFNDGVDQSQLRHTFVLDRVHWTYHIADEALHLMTPVQLKATVDQVCDEIAAKVREEMLTRMLKACGRGAFTPPSSEPSMQDSAASRGTP